MNRKWKRGKEVGKLWFGCSPTTSHVGWLAEVGGNQKSKPTNETKKEAKKETKERTAKQESRKGHHRKETQTESKKDTKIQDSKK